jgi:beta-glucosidase
MNHLLKNSSQFSLKEKIGQMIIVRASGYLFDHQIRYPIWEATNGQLQHWLGELNFGGVILLGGSAAELAIKTKKLQEWAKTPLLISADIEEGVGQRFTGATWFPPLMSLGAIASEQPSLAENYAQQMGKITAQEALAIGLNWILAPVVDVNNNPHNPVINVRSFGDNPKIVGDLATAFIQGAKQYPILTTAKHFPGHGDTATDSHLELPILAHSIERLETVELLPFQRAIAANVDTVMSAHLLIPAWDQKHPATLSPAILTGILREKLGFSGLIVTDALVMGGISQIADCGEVAVRAVEAGADILLMPPDPEIALEAVYQAVKTGRLTEERIEASWERIRAKKQALYEQSDPLEVTEKLALPQFQATVADIIRDSLQSGGNLPLIPQKGRNLVVVDDLLNCDFLDRQTPAITIPQTLGYELQLVDQRMLGYISDQDQPVLLQVFIRGNPFRGQAGLTAIAQETFTHLIETKTLQGLILYGSPYILDWFKQQLPQDFPWIFSYGQMPIAQAIACQSLFHLSNFSDLHFLPFI